MSIIVDEVGLHIFAQCASSQSHWEQNGAQTKAVSVTCDLYVEGPGGLPNIGAPGLPNKNQSTVTIDVVSIFDTSLASAWTLKRHSHGLHPS